MTNPNFMLSLAGHEKTFITSRPVLSKRIEWNGNIHMCRGKVGREVWGVVPIKSRTDQKLTVHSSAPKIKNLLPSSLKIIASSPLLPENECLFSSALQNPWEDLSRSVPVHCLLIFFFLFVFNFCQKKAFRSVNKLAIFILFLDSIHWAIPNPLQCY